MSVATTNMQNLNLKDNDDQIESFKSKQFVSIDPRYMHEKQRAPGHSGHRHSVDGQLNLDQFFNKTNSMSHSQITPTTPPSPSNKKKAPQECGINITKSYVFECKRYPVYRRKENSFEGLKSVSTE